MSEGYLSAPGARLFFRELGRGLPIVVLHGGPDFNHNYLLPELDRLATASRLIYYDQRGRGKSAANVAPESVGIESEVDDLDRLRHHFGLDAIALLGHSFGALIAMEYAARHPDRLSHLVLMNPAPASHVDLLRFRERRGVTEAESLAAMQSIAATPEYIAGDVAAEADYYRLHYGKALYRADQIDTVVRRLRVHFTRADIVTARTIEDRLYEQTWNAPDYSVLDRLRTLTAPTLVIHGEHDFVPMESSNHIAEAIQGSHLVVLRECGHFAYLERPDEVLAAVLRFLSSDRLCCS